MKTIWKWSLVVTDSQYVEMPQGAELLHVANQHPIILNTIELWARVDPDAPTVRRKFLIHGTGHPLDHDLPFVGTVIAAEGQLVWHVFDGGEV